MSKVIYCDRICEMWQSPKNNPTYYMLRSGVRALKTGDMSTCVSVIFLGCYTAGEYQIVCGQHGEGDIYSINLKKMIKRLPCINDPNSKFVVVFNEYYHNVDKILREIGVLLEEVPEIVHPQFELYSSGNAQINRNGFVVDRRGLCNLIISFPAWFIRNMKKHFPERYSV